MSAEIEIDGIRYCVEHDDFAIEGYDYSEVCHEAWGHDQEHGNPDEDPKVERQLCRLVPMFRRPHETDPQPKDGVT